MEGELIPLGQKCILTQRLRSNVTVAAYHFTQSNAAEIGRLTGLKVLREELDELPDVLENSNGFGSKRFYPNSIILRTEGENGRYFFSSIPLSQIHKLTPIQ